MLAQLAWDCLQGSKDAVGENDGLTRELLALYKSLSRLQNELSNPTSLVNRANDERRLELEEHAAECEGILRVMNTVLAKYNALGREERKSKRLWQKIQFGNGETKDLRDIRNELSAYTSAITMGFNLCALHSPGRVETTLEMAEEQSRRHGRSLRGLRTSLHWVIANLSAEVGEGSVRSSYANDDKIFWRTLRNELVKEGYDNYELQKHRRLIKDYVEELVNRGVLDDQGTDNARHIPRPRLHKVRSNFYLQNPSPVDSWSPPPPEHYQLPPSLAISPLVSEEEDVEMADVSTNEDEFEDEIIEEVHDSPIFDNIQRFVSRVENPEESDLSSSTLIEEADHHPNSSPSKQTTYAKNFAVHVEEVTDEEFVRHRNVAFDNKPKSEFPKPAFDKNEVEEHPIESSESSDNDEAARQWKNDFHEEPRAELSESASDVDEAEKHQMEQAEASNDEVVQYIIEPARETVILESSLKEEDEAAPEKSVINRAPPVEIEEILDDDFVSGSHPNVYLDEDTTQDSDTERRPIVEKLSHDSSVHVSSGSMSSQKGSLKRVRWAEDDTLSNEQRSSPCKYAPEDLPFIFHREFRDFDKYQELQESSQALMEEQEAGRSRRKRSDQSSRTCSFVTQKEYIPPATLCDLQYYRIPASYFHKFWHPSRVPIYLHGNVFDGITFTHWIYGWTAYTFRDDSFEMSTVKRFGKQVMKLGSAMTDIENADDSAKRKLPRPLYDESGRLWENLENIVNDIMAESEDRLAKKRRGGRLEVEFVTKFCREMIAGDKYYRPIETWLKQTDDWCKKVRFHKDFVMLWDLWAV
jgi:hypothetical protein